MLKLFVLLVEAVVVAFILLESFMVSAEGLEDEVLLI